MLSDPQPVFSLTLRRERFAQNEFLSCELLFSILMEYIYIYISVYFDPVSWPFFLALKFASTWRCLDHKQRRPSEPVVVVGRDPCELRDFLRRLVVQGGGTVPHFNFHSNWGLERFLFMTQVAQVIP